ncbi:MAG: error-prone DNA polymerase [Anaerolineae bacterium]|nr:error-prone DNA polymerase [Anaerolineae bacterium]
MSDYVELHCHSNFSLLDGASSPEDLIKRAVELRMHALALTDHDAVYGTIQFATEAREQGIHPILGAEITLESGHHLTLLVENETGWRNLCWLISQSRANAPKGQSALPEHYLEGHVTGLIALSGCRRGRIASALLNKDWEEARVAAERYRDWFGTDHFFMELQNHALPKTDMLLYKLVMLAKYLNLPYVATNNVHYARRDASRLQDILVCIKHNTSIDQASQLRRPNTEFYLKSAAEIEALFESYPEALSNTIRVAERCRFNLTYGLQDLPIFPVPVGYTAETYLRNLCELGMRKRLAEISTKATDLLTRELSMISRAGLANYFLIVWDIVRYANEHGILCQGRGSAANSLAAYLLNISPINPIAHDLVFERFLSEERQNAPDIDIDFQADRREEVIQYVYKRYGRDHAAMACTLVTFRSRSAVREIGKAFGLPPELIDVTATSIGTRNPTDASLISQPKPEATSNNALPADFQVLCQQIYGFPRHLGIHNGGMVISGLPISTRVPTEPATMPDRTVIQWDKNSLEDAGLIKIDILGLRMLSLLAEAVGIVEQQTGQRPDLSHLTLDDPAVFAMIQKADTIGVFQVESRAQAQVLPRMLPNKFNDLVVSISLIRPGPVQGNMVHPYLRRHLGEEPVRYAHPLLKPALAETLGVILFQEQVLKVARDLGRLTAGQGEQLRRALAKSDTTAIDRFKLAFMDGAKTQGVSQRVAEEVFRQLQAFGGYSFPKSHAAAFAVLVYQSAWLKCHHPTAFYIALLNNQPMGFWSPAVIVNDARRHGIRVLSVNVHRSEAKCTVEGNAIRLGFKYVNGIGDEVAARITRARTVNPFTNLTDFCRRTQIPRLLIERLIMVGAMDGWRGSRRQRLWQLGEIHYSVDELPLRHIPIEIDLPPQSRPEALHDEFSILGLTTGDHVMTLYRSQLSQQGILSSADLVRLRSDVFVKVAGLVVVHQAPPTAKGHHFITLEDEHGMLNIIFRPDIYARYERQVVEAPILIIAGTLQRKGDVINVIARQADTLQYEISQE